jgi:hypothetical protein
MPPELPNAKNEIFKSERCLFFNIFFYSFQIVKTRAIDTWSVHGCVGFPIPVSG